MRCIGACLKNEAEMRRMQAKPKGKLLHKAQASPTRWRSNASPREILWRKINPIYALCIFLLIAFLIPKSNSYTMENVYVSLNNGSSLGLGTYEDYYVLVEVTSGSINSTLSILETNRAAPNDGSWTFQSNVTGSLLFSDPAQDYDLQASGGTITHDDATGYVTVSWSANEQVSLYWNSILEPILPFGFILGMVGLGSMFGGTLWTVKKIKDHEFNEAITEGFVIALLGIALFMAWLAMA